MNECIDRQKAIEAFRNADTDIMADYGEYYGTESGFSRERAEGILNSLPTVNAQSAAYEWIRDEYGGIRCGACNKRPTLLVKTPHCPNCGAKMNME